jgi:hypothetical protein
MKSLVCINADDLHIEIRLHLTVGKVYIVVSEYHSGYHNGWIVIIDDTGDKESYPLERFMDLSEYRKKKLERIKDVVSNR